MDSVRCGDGRCRPGVRSTDGPTGPVRPDKLSMLLARNQIMNCIRELEANFMLLVELASCRI